MEVLGGASKLAHGFNTFFRPSASHHFFEFLDSTDQIVNVVSHKFGLAIRPLFVKIRAVTSFLMLYVRGVSVINFIIIGKKEAGKEKSLKLYVGRFKRNLRRHSVLQLVTLT